MGFSLGKIAKGIGGFIANPTTALSVLSAGADLVGGIMQNKENRRITDRQMDFQREMSNTSHQREVADLRAAGLNPILSANSGASTPSGASYNASNVVAPAVNSAMRSRELSLSIQQAEAQRDLMRSQERTVQAQGRAADTQSNLNETNRYVQSVIAQQQEITRDLMKTTFANAIKDSDYNTEMKRLLLPGMRNSAKFESTVGEMGAASKFGVQLFRDIFGAANSARDVFATRK